MLTNAPEYNAVGGGFGGGFGGFGFGGGGILEGIILASLLGRRGLGFDGHDGGGHDGCAREAALLAAISNNKDVSVAEARALGAAICDSEKTNLQQFYAGAIQAANNTNLLQTQASAIAALTDSKLDLLSRQVAADGDATRALINSNEMQNLRDELFEEKRGRDRDGISISIQNSNAQAQAQAQAQFQAQNEFLARKFFEFENQMNITKQGIINLGTMVASGTQSTAATNIK